MQTKYNIAVVGMGYVGMSVGAVLSQKNNVIFVDIDQKKVDLLNKKKSPIDEEDLNKFLAKKELSFSATKNNKNVFLDVDFVIVATPTNYDEKTNEFDTLSVDSVAKEAIVSNPNLNVIIKSTIPFGHTKKLREQLSTDRIIFSPEFLREGSSLHDNLYPSRIIVGDTNQAAKSFGKLLQESSIEENAPILYMNSEEAEAIKLFANSYLAMRVAFFNELDSYALNKNLNPKNLIDGISLDPRIGDYYNNPSFGYGGYCLPKDTKQLQTNFSSLPEALISAVVESNAIRKEFIYREIKKMKPNLVGVYRLIMKDGSNNFRESAVFDIIKKLIDSGTNILIYEPIIHSSSYHDLEVTQDLDFFKKTSDVIVANRNSLELLDVKDKIFTRDIFGEN